MADLGKLFIYLRKSLKGTRFFHVNSCIYFVVMLTLPKLPQDEYNPKNLSLPLKETDVFKLRDFYGPNTVLSGKKGTWYKLLFESLLHPFNILLIILAITSGLAKEYETMGIMLVMVLLSTVLRFHQEWKSQVAVESLLQYVATKVTVIRNDMVTFQDMEFIIPSSELVPGDWIKLGPGDMIPADVELLDGKEFHVSQAALTGEAIPVLKYSRGRVGSWVSPTEKVLQGLTGLQGDLEEKKHSEKCGIPLRILYLRFWNRVRRIFGLSAVHNGYQDTLEPGNPSAGVNFSDMDRPDVCFMGSAVISGKATCRVVNTGHRTAFGKLAKELGQNKPPNTFQLGVRRISWLFFALMICMVPPVLLLQGFLHNDWFDAFMFALSVAVGLTPEMLPMIVNTTLAKGAVEMSRKKCIVKQLDGIVIMGAVNVLCTDKTGTLTKSVVSLHTHVNVKGTTSPIPLLLGYLNAYYHTCHENPLDTAITSYYADNYGDDKFRIKDSFTFVEEIPFDFVRRRLSVIVKQTAGGGKTVLVCKGAVEEILEVCSAILLESDRVFQDLESVLHGNPTVETMTEKKQDQLQNLYEKLSEDGLRVIAVAYKLVTIDTAQEMKNEFGVQAERDLIFAGFLAFLDPPKESTREAIQNLMEHNVSVKVLTGDNPLVCKKICGEIGLKVDQVITGQELEEMTRDRQNSMKNLRRIAEEHTIFAKLTPIQKSDIVKALKLNGHVVGFLGDGINDAPALSEADVGISVDTGMDICKESADIILLEKDLRVIVDAVVTGRRTYGNTVKYLVMSMSSNFGNVFSILIASAWLPFQPMASLHVLVQNLLYDTSQMAIPWDTMDPEYLLVPHQWCMKNVVRFMIMIGPWSSLFDIATFLFLYFYFGIQTADDEAQVRGFQSSWFCVGMLTQTLIVHIIRTKKIPFLQSWATLPVVGMTLIIMCIGLSLPYIPGLSKWLMLVPLPWELYPFMGAVLVSYCFVVQLAKILYLKIFKEWY